MYCLRWTCVNRLLYCSHKIWSLRKKWWLFCVWKLICSFTIRVCIQTYNRAALTRDNFLKYSAILPPNNWNSISIGEDVGNMTAHLLSMIHHKSYLESEVVFFESSKINRINAIVLIHIYLLYIFFSGIFLAVQVF